MNAHRNDAVTQSDIDQLQADLEALQQGMQSDKSKIIGQIDQIITHTQQLKQNASGGRFEPAINSVHDLLVSLRQGVSAQARLTSLQS